MPSASKDLSPVLFRGIFFIALATLTYEVSLIRVLSYTIWHHFGYVTISTALLGFGASGTILAVRPEIGKADLRNTLALGSVLTALSGAGMLLFVSQVPLHPMSILSSAREAAVFVLYQIFAAVPFFFGGLVISLSLREGARRVDRLYFWDLVGAAVGCALALALMNSLAPPGAVLVAAAAAGVAGLIYATSGALRIGAAAVTLVLLAASPFARDLPFEVARTKQLSLIAMGREPIHELTRWTALFRTDVVDSGHLAQLNPGCREWGMSRLAPPECERPVMHIAHDATAGTGIYDLRDGPTLDYLDWNVLHLPYLVANPESRVLVIGVGGGRDVVAAIQYGASHVVGAELDVAAIDIIRDDLDESAGFFQRSDIELIETEGRHFVRASEQDFDVIQLTGVDTLSAEFSGSYVLAENYLYTVDALHDYFDSLAPGGMLSFAMGNVDSNKPKAVGRIVSVAQQALRERGVDDPSRHIAVIGSHRLYAEVMIRPEPFTEAQVAKLAARASELDLPVILLPGREGHPVFQGLVSLTGPARDAMLSRLEYVVSAITDDRPFFFSFFRWKDLMSGGRLAPTHASALGQIVLGLLVVTLTALGAVFVLGPLFAFRRRGIAGSGRPGLGILAYFTALGLGFMLFEISLIQRFVLFLGYPTYSLGVTLASLLFFLGCGSFVSRRFVGREAVVLPLAVVGIAGLAAFYMIGLPIIQDQFLASPILLRVAITVAVLAPLGLVLGIFFPLGIRRAEAVHQDMVPWAWGINGCASVTGSVLTVVLAIQMGFMAVWMASVVVYALGVAALLMTTTAPSADDPEAA